jgi:hypothetical protein
MKKTSYGLLLAVLLHAYNTVKNDKIEIKDNLELTRMVEKDQEMLRR